MAHLILRLCTLAAMEFPFSLAMPMQGLGASEITLNEDGYQKVVSLKSDGDMKTFIRRLLAHLGLEPADEGELSGFTPHYSGTEATQSFDRLQEELLTVPWTRQSSPAVLPAELTPVPRPKEIAATRQVGKTVAKASPGKGGKAGLATLRTQPHPEKSTALQHLTPQKPGSAHKDAAASRPVGKIAAKAFAWKGEKVAAHGANKPIHEKPMAPQHMFPQKLGDAHQDAAAIRPVEKFAAKAPPISSKDALFPHGPDSVQRWGQGKAKAKKAPAGKGGKAAAHEAITFVHEKPMAQQHMLPQKLGDAHKEAPMKHNVLNHKLSAQGLQGSPDPAGRKAAASLARNPLTYSTASKSRDDVSLLQSDSEPVRGASDQMHSTLPPVGKVLETATSHLKDFAADTDKMRREVQLRQQHSKANLAATKKKFEDRLAELKAEHQATLKANDAIRDNITQVNATNVALAGDVHRAKKSIHILRHAMKKLRHKLEVARGFVGDSVNVTDISNSSELNVLDVTTPAPTFDDFLYNARKELGLRATSAVPAQEALDSEEDEEAALLQLSSLPAAELEEEGNLDSQDPKKMTALLRATLATLGEAEQKGQQMLLQRFQASEAAWKQHIKESVAEQHALTSQLSDATARRRDLEAARQSLRGTDAALRFNLERFSSFFDSMDEAVLNAMPLAAGQGHQT